MLLLLLGLLFCLFSPIGEVCLLALRLLLLLLLFCLFLPIGGVFLALRFSPSSCEHASFVLQKIPSRHPRAAGILSTVA